MTMSNILMTHLDGVVGGAPGVQEKNSALQLLTTLSGKPAHKTAEAGGCRHECRLIIHIKLTNLEKEETFHFAAWSGNIIHDHPYMSMVSKKSDRNDEERSKMVFAQLRQKDFQSWQITNVYQLVCTHTCKDDV